jgi:geranylgeranyl pyrophosphate synthase
MSQSTGFDLDAFLRAEAAAVDAALSDAAGDVVRGAPLALARPITYALGTRGKRLRPVLAVAAYRAVSGREATPDVRRLACALEIVHTYSLVHDDLPCMDDDALRRGRPTVHVVHGVAAATLAGAALVPAAVAVMDTAARALGLDAATRARLVAELCRAGGAAGMVGGQLLDLEGEAVALDLEALERIHRGKTGALLAASLRIGALAAGAGEEALAALTVYGQELGLAFQIVDDVLDVTGSAESLGKTAGKDQSSGKSTYPALFGLDGARGLAEEHGAAAVAALHGAGIHAPPLEALVRFVLERRS